jgi:hypothetical protein
MEIEKMMDWSNTPEAFVKNFAKIILVAYLTRKKKRKNV